MTSILRMKLTPRPESALDEISFYSCPDVKNDPAKTLKHIQKTADERNVAVDYALVTDFEYFAVRGAREWLITEPGDVDADHLFRVKCVRAGIAKDTSQILLVEMTGRDGYTVRVVTPFEEVLIDSKTGTITQHQFEQAAKAHPASGG